MKKSMFIGTTTHGIPKLDTFEKKFKDVVPLSMRDMDGFRQPKGTVYNAVLLKRPLSAQGVLIQKNINRTAFLQDDKIQNRLNLYIKHNQNIHSKSVRVRPKAFNQKENALVLVMKNFIDFIYWKPLREFHNKIIVNLPFSGYILEDLGNTYINKCNSKSRIFLVYL